MRESFLTPRAVLPAAAVPWSQISGHYIWTLSDMIDLENDFVQQNERAVKQLSRVPAPSYFNTAVMAVGKLGDLGTLIRDSDAEIIQTVH